MAEPAPKKIDISKHILVPNFVKLSEEEIRQVLEAYNISPVQLPSILLKDPMAKLIGAKVGDVLKIERKSQVGREVYFRRVVE